MAHQRKIDSLTITIDFMTVFLAKNNINLYATISLYVDEATGFFFTYHMRGMFA